MMMMMLIVLVVLVVLIYRFCAEKQDKNPKIGDLIEIFRGRDQHWAIYVGDGDVVHLASDSEHANALVSSNMSFSLIKKATVKKEKLEDVVGEDNYSINNYLDEKYNKRPDKDIVDDVNSCVGEKHPYNLLTNNCEHFVTRLRNGKACSSQCVGDLIEIFRGLYQHWAIYVGDGDVVHLTSDTNAIVSSVISFASSSKMGTVKKEKLEDVVGKDNYRINNLLDKKYKPRPIKCIVEEANRCVWEKRPYNLVTMNCEHFVTRLRNGKACSSQI